MGRLGTTELILILVAALVIFGPKKLPELGKMAGKALRSARGYFNGQGDWDDEEEDVAPVAPAQVTKAEPVAKATAVEADEDPPPEADVEEGAEQLDQPEQPLAADEAAVAAVAL